MKIIYIEQDGKKTSCKLDKNFSKVADFSFLNGSNKRAFVQKFYSAFAQAQKMVLFDNKHLQLVEFYKEKSFNTFKGIENFPKEAQILFFTSGSSGFPVGAFKTLQNLEQEVQILYELLKHRGIKKVVVSVPFIHIYGILAGLLLPQKLQAELIIKEDFLPYELLEEAKAPNTLVVTTPVFIKALNRLSKDLKLDKTLFLSSTGPLHKDDVTHFEKKYTTKLMQLFGSTETGGIAYKVGDTDIWTPLPLVSVITKKQKLAVQSPFVSSHLLKKNIQKLIQPFISEDIIAIKEDGFILLGRGNKLIKIAGKRVSAHVIEMILEEMDGIVKAVVELVYKKELLRSEQILITLQATKQIDKQEIKNKITTFYGVLTIPFRVVYVDEINITSMGKKVLF